MKTEHFVGYLNGVPILCTKVTKGDETITRPLTETELKLLAEELNGNISINSQEYRPQTPVQG